MVPLGKDNDPKFQKVCDKDDLIRVRDTEQNSWAKVAQVLGLGSPGAARRVYSLAVRPHTESKLVSIGGGSAKVTPVHLADANLAAVREAIVGRTIVVQRKDRTEEINSSSSHRVRSVWPLRMAAFVFPTLTLVFSPLVRGNGKAPASSWSGLFCGPGWLISLPVLVVGSPVERRLIATSMPVCP